MDNPTYTQQLETTVNALASIIERRHRSTDEAEWNDLYLEFLRVARSLEAVNAGAKQGIDCE